MNQAISIGILKETKTPADKRVTVTPEEGVRILELYPNVKLFIIGAGPLLNELQRTAKELKIEHAIIFAGYQENVFPFLIYRIRQTEVPDRYRESSFPLSFFDRWEKNLVGCLSPFNNLLSQW